MCSGRHHMTAVQAADQLFETVKRLKVARGGIEPSTLRFSVFIWTCFRVFHYTASRSISAELLSNSADCVVQAFSASPGEFHRVCYPGVTPKTVRRSIGDVGMPTRRFTVQTVKSLKP